MTYLDLPDRLPLLTVYGAVVFPDAELPLPMSEQQYENLLTLSEDTDFIVGIVQPKKPNEQLKKNLPVFQSGTAARIVGASEIEDSMFIVNLKGLCRFNIEDDYVINNRSRYAKVSYNKYIYADSIPTPLKSFDKTSFISLASTFMRQYGINPNWKELDKISPLELINFITMIGPLDPSEKQAILEIPYPNDQKSLLEQIMAMSLTDSISISTLKH